MSKEAMIAAIGEQIHDAEKLLAEEDEKRLALPFPSAEFQASAMLTAGYAGRVGGLRFALQLLGDGA